MKEKKKSISKLKKEAWKEFSLWVRSRDGFTCITCGKKGSGSFMHAGHYISRKHNATMFHEKNVHAQCMNCNLWGYGNMGVYTQKIILLYGKEIVDELVKESLKIKQFTPQELIALKNHYRELNKKNPLNG